MKTHEITTSKGEFIVEEVNCYDIEIYNAFEDPKTYRKGILLEPMFLISEATEEDAKLIVDEPEYIPCYNCLNGCPVCSGYGYSISWTNELHSLLKSKGIDINNGNWYLFKKI